MAEDGGKNEAHLAYFYQSYFDRPEVIKSFRQQEAIETPVWGQIPKDAVGGRLRHRNGVEVCPTPLFGLASTALFQDHFDTSDHAYIQRHRKFETFEKRQRRREKEKLEHEHHKLKNRIDQLRALDAPAFGGKDITESEKNRDNMLATAVDLEQRYRVLLPDPRRPDKRRPGIDEAALPPNSTSDSRVKVTIKLPASVTPEVFPTNPEISAPQTPGTSPRRLPKQKNIRKRKGQRAVSQDVIPSDSRITNHISVPTSSIRVHAGSSRYGSRYFPDPANSIGSAPDSPGAVSGPEDEDPYSWSEAPLSSRPYKKQRRGTSLGPRSEDANRSVSDGALLRAARWAEGASRKTKRGVDPFGVRLPDMFNVLTDFDIWSPASFFKECLGEARETTLEESHEEIQVKNAESEELELLSEPQISMA